MFVLSVLVISPLSRQQNIIKCGQSVLSPLSCYSVVEGRVAQSTPEGQQRRDSWWSCRPGVRSLPATTELPRWPYLIPLLARRSLLSSISTVKVSFHCFHLSTPTTRQVGEAMETLRPSETSWAMAASSWHLTATSDDGRSGPFLSSIRVCFL